MRILTIIPYKILPAQLGGEKGIAVFNEYLAKKTELTGITTANNDPSLAKGYRLLNILSNYRIRYADFLLFFKIRKLIQSLKITHLITEHPYYAWLAWMVRKFTGVKWIVHSHNIEYMRSRSIGRWWWKSLKMYEQWAYKSADKVFFISEDDMKHAMNHMAVPFSKSQVVTFGIETLQLPSDREECKKQVSAVHDIDIGYKILLFNGALYHSTNYDALKVILDEINPVLQAKENFWYKIIVCGKGLPESFNNLEAYRDKNVIYAGFVDDITVYFKGADIFLNPILSGAGVKTKAIEAIAMDCTVVSTALGALGIKREVCGDKLRVLEEGDWKKFAELIIDSSSNHPHTPVAFFDYYSWDRIIDKVVSSLQKEDA